MIDDCFRDKFASVDSKAITDGRIGDFYSSSYEREVTATPQCSIKSDQFEYVNRIGHDSDLPQLDTGKTKSWDQVNVNRSVPLYDAMMDLSDSNLEAKLKFQWRLDRTKKAIRKKEREELRLLGRIGKGQKGKYEKIKNQVSIDIEKEIDKLLCSTSERYSNIPTDHNLLMKVVALSHHSDEQRGSLYMRLRINLASNQNL